MKAALRLSLFNLALFLLVRIASAQVNITTWQFDKQHWGNNNQETILTPAKVAGSGNFDTLFTQPMVGVSYGQPLYVSNLTMADGTTHNVVFAATQHCMLYAFDADDKDPTKGNDKPRWVKTLFDPNTSYPPPQKDSDNSHRDGYPGTISSGDIKPELGITTTPVIDLPSKTLFVVTKLVASADLSFHQFLHAIDITSGNERPGSPVKIYTTFPGLTDTGESPDTHTIPFNAQNQHLRAAMALDHGLLYLTYASHGDHTPYHGMVLAYDPSSLTLVKKFIASNVGSGSNCGIWMAGASPGFDDTGNLYVMTGNGSWSHDNNGDNWSHTFVKLTPDTFNITKSNPLNWFTPYNWSDLNNGDRDLGAGGPLLLPDQAGPHPHLVLGAGKEGSIYVVDRDAMGGINTAQNNNNIVQVVPSTAAGFYNTVGYFNGCIYYAAGGDKLTQRAVGYNVSGPGTYVSTTPTRSDDPVGFRGATPFISSNDLNDGIVWVLSGGLRAYDAKSVAGKPIYQSGTSVDGVSCDVAKFGVPTVANGKAYYPLNNKAATTTAANNTSYLVVAGLFGQSADRPKEPSNVSATATSSSTATITWTDNSTSNAPAQTFVISRSTQRNGGYTPLPTRAPAGDRSQPNKTFSDGGLQPGTTYYYQVAASAVVNGQPANSINVGPAAATTFPAYVENGLVAFWNFDSVLSGNVPDVTGNGHTGTTSGEIGFVNGVVNTCFDTHGKGNDLSNITVPNAADLQFTAQQSFTLALWVKSAFFNPFEEAIIAKSRDVGNYYGLYIALNADGSRTWSARGPNPALNLDGGPVGGGWTHLALVQDGAAGKRYFYVNGVLANAGQAQAGDGPGALCMTQQNIGSNEASFAGDIDEVRIYNRALAANEVPHLMGSPVLEVHSNVTHAGGVGTQGVSLWPSLNPKSEPRTGTGATQGQYTLVVSFASPASVDTVTLQRRDGGMPVATMGQPSFDATGRVLTVPLAGVGNAQALNLHLANVTPGGGAMDVPFNVLWGDVNGDGVVNGIDLRAVQGNELNPAAVAPFPTSRGVVSSTRPSNPSVVTTGANCQYDFNADGKIDDADAALLTNNPSIANASVAGGQTDTNLAFYGSANISSLGGGSTLLGAFDNNAATRLDTLENSPSVDPSWIMVDLGSVGTIRQVALNWQAAGKNYTIDVSDDLNGADPRPDLQGGTNWRNYDGESANTNPTLSKTYTHTTTGRYVRIYGVTRATNYGYAIYEFQVFGRSGSGGSLPAAKPVVSPIPTQSATGGSAFSYQVAASNNPTGYSLTGIPWLTISNSGLVTGTAPTSGGTYTASVTATNAGGTSDPVALQVNVSAAPTGSKPVVSAISAQNVTAGSAFSYQASATNNPTSYGASGVPWMSVNGSGLITGTVPAGNGFYTAAVTATNAYGTSDAVTLQINATAPATPKPVVSAIPAQNTAGGAIFSYPVSATNSPTNYAVAGIPWLGVNNSGLISGTVPADGGPYAGSVTATNAGGTSDPVALQINVRPAVTGTLSQSVVAGATFNYRIMATNTPISYKVSGQSWLSVSASGVVGGTAPSTPGTYAATVNATNAAGTSPDATLTITVTSPSTTLTNVALYQQASASSMEAAGYGPNRAVDGDKTGSRWSSAKSDVENITVDLGVPMPLSQVVLVWQSAYGKRYVIQGASDPVGPWTPLYTQNNGVGGTETLPVSGTCRYVRMQGVQRAGGYGYSLYEFQVMSAQPPAWTNKAQAPGVSATASSSENAGLAPNLAIDGRRDTRWSSAHTDNESIEINFGVSTAISQVTLFWENAYGARYIIEATNDKAVGWTSLVTQDNGAGGIETFNFSVVSYQYLRMRGVKRASAFGYSLWELQVR